MVYLDTKEMNQKKKLNSTRYGQSFSDLCGEPSKVVDFIATTRKELKRKHPDAVKIEIEVDTCISQEEYSNYDFVNETFDFIVYHPFTEQELEAAALLAAENKEARVKAAKLRIEELKKFVDDA